MRGVLPSLLALLLIYNSVGAIKNYTLTIDKPKGGSPLNNFDRFISIIPFKGNDPPHFPNVVDHFSQASNFDLGEDIALCQDSYTIEVPGKFRSYQWSNGSGEPAITVNTSGTYHLTITDKNGNTATDSITVTLLSPAVLNLGDDTISCKDSLILFGGGGFFSYQWSNGATTPRITVQENGIYGLTVRTENHCTLKDSIQVSFPQKPSGHFSYQVRGRQVEFKAEVPEASAFHWDFGDGKTHSIKEPKHQYAEEGSYIVRLEASNPCQQVTIQNTILIRQMADKPSLITDLKNRRIPRSSSTVVAEITDKTLEPVYWQLYDTQGQLVFSQNTPDQSQTDKDAPDLENFPPGVYLLRIDTGQEIKYRKIVLE